MTQDGKFTELVWAVYFEYIKSIGGTHWKATQGLGDALEALFEELAGLDEERLVATFQRAIEQSLQDAE